MEPEIKKTHEKILRTFNEFKEANDKRLETIEKSRGVADLEEKLDKLNEALDAKEDRILELETAVAREGTEITEVDGKSKEIAAKAMSLYLRKGVAPTAEELKHFGAGAPEEIKTLLTQSDPDGGYFVRPEYSSQITKKVFESSPMREIATVVQTSTDEWREVADFDEASAGWVSEQGTRSTGSSPQLDMLSIPVHEMFSNIPASQRLLDDAAINVEQWLADKIADKQARLEATAFIAGDGVGKPRGITQYTAGTSYGQVEQVNSGSAGAATADGLIDLQNALKEAYQMNASFLMKRATRGTVRKLKDGQGQYLWGIQGDVTQGFSMDLLGKPVRLADDMPGVGSNALAIAYGDFRQGYIVVDRIGIRVLRDPYSSKPNVLFYTTKRVGGGVRNFEAIKLQKLAS